MGLLGLRKFVDATGCTKLLPVPLREDEARAQAEQLAEKHRHARGTPKPGYGGRHAWYASEDDSDGTPEAPEKADAEDEEQEREESVPRASASPAAQPDTPVADHVLVDMNCIVHSCFGRQDVTTKTRKELIQSVMERLRVLLTQVVTPRKSLTICLDGPAPYAKLQTQRLRRRKVALLDSSAQRMSSLAITAGSLFLVELENALGAQFKLNGGRGFLRRLCPVHLLGSTVMGEGESKVARMLAFLASQAPQTHPGSSADGFSNLAGPYNPNDSVVVVGNDIDLVLTCIGATPFHNISIVGPSALQLVNTSDILYRWLKATTTASGASGADALRVTPEVLPSMRVDFIFLFALNGGDHYVGAGEVAMPLWRRYRTVRSAYANSTLVSPRLNRLDTEFLVDLLDAREYTGDADPGPGLQLLQSALWSVYTTVTGICPDYAYAPEPSSPFLQNLRAAAARLRRGGRHVSLHYDTASTPLTPLEAYVALMPNETALPTSVAAALRQKQSAPAKDALTPQQISSVLAASNDTREVADAAKAAVALAAPLLSVSERYLCQFTPPVQLNALPPRRRVPRHEQHRMLAQTGAVVFEDPIPMVRRIDCSMSTAGSPAAAPAGGAGLPLALPLPYVQWRYPADVTQLRFHSPFDAEDTERCVGLTQGRRGGAGRGDASIQASAATARAQEQLDSSMAELASLRRHKERGTLRSEARLRLVQRQTVQLQQALARCQRAEANVDAESYALEDSSLAKVTAQRELSSSKAGQPPAEGSRHKRGRDETVQPGTRQAPKGESGAANDGASEDDDDAFLAEIERFLGCTREEVARVLASEELVRATPLPPHRRMNSAATQEPAATQPLARPARTPGKNRTEAQPLKKPKKAAKKSAADKLPKPASLAKRRRK